MKYRILGVLLAVMFALGCVGCNNGSGNGTQNPPDGQDPETPPQVTQSVYEVYDGSGNMKYQTENVFMALINAGKWSTSRNRHCVKCGEQIVFEYNQRKYYKFLGSAYAGDIDVDPDNTSAADATAESFAANNPTAYVINGKGTAYVALGRDVMPGSSAVNGGTFGMELFSGSYMYAYTKRNDANSSFEGISYIEFTLDFTGVEFKYPESEAESGWNAYIFANLFTTSPWGSCDMGLICSTETARGVWQPFFSMSGDRLFTPKMDAITTMQYDEQTDTYKGTDILDFRAYVTRKSYCMEFYNRTTGKKYEYTLDCKTDALQKKADKAFGLLAASYCPVLNGTELWNARSGAVYKGLKFRNPKTAKFMASATCADDYKDAPKTDFLPSEPSVFGYGFAQGADNASYTIGEDSKGKYIESNISYTEN